MTVQQTESAWVAIDPKRIYPNPWQPRLTMDMVELAELTESIRTRGLLQPPLVRRSHVHAGGFELAFGHRRFAAWVAARPGEPFPCVMEALSDRQMAEAAATENAHRQDLNPVDRARGLKRLIGEFQMTQTEAGKLYGLATQGAVSNAIRLLDLPDKILDLVAAGKLPEKHARSLIFIGRVDAKVATDIAVRYAAGSPSGDDARSEDVLRDAIIQFFRKHGEAFPSEEVWPLEWLPKDVDIRVTVKGEEPYTAPACSGCPFYWNGHYEQYCARPACFKAKVQAYAEEEAVRASKRLGLALLDKKNGLPAPIFYKGQWGLGDLVDAEVKAKATHLRVAPFTGEADAWNRKKHLGSRWIALGSADVHFIERLKAKQEQDRKRSIYTPPDPEEQRKAEAERQRRFEADRALATGASKQFAQLLPSQPRLLALLASVVPGPSVHLGEDERKFEATWKTAKVDERRRMLAELILVSAHDINRYRAPDPSKLREQLVSLAKECKVKLATGWDALPAEAKAPAFGQAGHLAGNGKKPAKKTAAKKTKAKAKK